MAKEGVLKTETRSTSGTAAARRMRKTGRLPAVIGLEDGTTRAVSLDQHAFELMLHRHRSEYLILDVCVDEEAPRKMLLKEVQHHPLTGHPLHVDFMEVSRTRKMHIHIPIRLVGDPVGVAQEGGVLEQPLRSIEVECFADDLVEEVLVDVSELKMNHSILVRDLKLSDKLTILAPPDIAVAAVSAPRIEEEVKPAEEGATAEPEVIGSKGKEAEAEGAAAPAEKAEKTEKKK